MRHLRLLRGSTEKTPEPNHAAKCQLKDAPALQPLREHAGLESRGNKSRSPANEQCLHRLIAKSLRLKGSVGPDSSDKSETLGMIAPPGCEHYVGTQRQTNALRLAQTR